MKSMLIFDSVVEFKTDYTDQYKRNKMLRRFGRENDNPIFLSALRYSIHAI